MSDLIDRAALPVSTWLDGDGNSQQAIKKADLDAAPTVECAACKHGRPSGTQASHLHAHQRCTMYYCRRHEEIMPEEYGCSLFQRRQP